MIWKKRDNCLSVADVVGRNSKMKISEFEKYEKNPYIKNSDNACVLIKQCCEKNMPITVVGDYDADGITAASILFLAIKELGIVPKVKIPRRFTDGYGLNVNIINNINAGLLITVDNGIAAKEAISAAKSKGLSVIVIDHHLCNAQDLPDADIIVDPHCYDEKCFVDYCGAGLAFRIAQKLINNEDLLQKLNSLAAIGTIADSVPLIQENRKIVKDGLSLLNQRQITSGMRALFQSLNVNNVTEEDIGYNIAPVINASGRLYDDGAMKVFRLLASESDDNEKLLSVAEELIEINQDRKSLVEAAVIKSHLIIDSEKIADNSCLCIYDESFHEGIVGIIAGRLSDEYKRPCIVFAKSKNENIIKGSARSCENVNIKACLDLVSEHIEKYGGHSGAAGISILLSKFPDFNSAINAVIYPLLKKSLEENVGYYDLDIAPEEISDFFRELEYYAPYGEKNNPIVFRIHDFHCASRYNSYFKFLGAEKTHIKLFGYKQDAIGFNIAKKYESLGLPQNLNLIGSLIKNCYMDNVSIQVSVTDFA